MHRQPERLISTTRHSVRYGSAPSGCGCTAGGHDTLDEPAQRGARRECSSRHSTVTGVWIQKAWIPGDRPESTGT